MEDINVQGSGKELEQRSSLKVPQIPSTLQSKLPNRQSKKQKTTYTKQNLVEIHAPDAKVIV